MTQAVEERPASTPLTKPVPGAWMQRSDLAPVYVPFEPQYRKNEQTGKDVLVGHAPGAHIKRLLSEDWMYTNAPGAAVAEPSPEVASTESALRAELEQAKREREEFFAELKALRDKLASDVGVPNAAKKR